MPPPQPSREDRHWAVLDAASPEHPRNIAINQCRVEAWQETSSPNDPSVGELLLGGASDLFGTFREPTLQ